MNILYVKIKEWFKRELSKENIDMYWEMFFSLLIVFIIGFIFVFGNLCITNQISIGGNTMGLCIGEDENKYKLDFEIRRESVIFYLENETWAEIDKKTLAKIVELCNDKKWNKKIFGEYR